MEQDDDGLMHLAIGPIAAIFLGAVLVPARELTTAANLTFPFLALTILVAEFGGRRAAVVTALVSALSMNFFLTQPYLTLAIHSVHDILAFAGLAGCGLIAAAFGSSRSRKAAALAATRRHLDLVHEGARRIDEAGPVEDAIGDVLAAAANALPLARVAVRAADGEVVAASRGARELGVPSAVLVSGTLLASTQSAPLPAEGGRIELRPGNRRVGWLDVWGNGANASAQARRTLSDVGSIVGALLSRREPGSGSSPLP